MIKKDLDTIFEALTYAKKYNLEIEVILWSLYAMKANPTLTIEEAIQIGLNEWVK